MTIHHIYKKHTFIVPKYSCHNAPYPRSHDPSWWWNCFEFLPLGRGWVFRHYGCYSVSSVMSLTHVSYSVTTHGTDCSTWLAQNVKSLTELCDLCEVLCPSVCIHSSRLWTMQCVLPSEMSSPQAVSLMCLATLIRTSTRCALPSVACVLRHPRCSLSSVYCHYQKHCTAIITVSFALHVLHTPSPTGNEILPSQHMN